MTFFQRWYNAVVSFYDALVRRFVFIPAEDALAKKYFAHLAPLPPLIDLLNNISVMFVNNHRALSPPRPAMPGTISIGGAHIKPAKSLPKDLQTFLDEAKDGVIYFSLGTVVKSALLPRDKLEAFIGEYFHLKIFWNFFI